MTQKPKHKTTETFRVIGVVREGRTFQHIYDDIESLTGDLLKQEDCAKSAAETIMHMCADIIVMSQNQKAKK